MKLSDKPRQLGVAFAQNGTRNTIPEQATQSSKEKGIATYDSGFPPVTMTAIAAGGIPPQGNDFNGVLNDITAAIRYDQAGGLYTYNAFFATSVNGYPEGAIVLSSDKKTIWWNSSDGNSSDPDSAKSTGWVRLAERSGLYLESAKNLADVQNKNAARLNLGLGTSATCDVGTASGTVAAGNDSRLVNAVQRGGDTMTGKLTLPQLSSFGINTTNALGGNSLVIGDNDTGFKESSDGVLDVYANNQQVIRFEPGQITSQRSLQYASSGGPVGSGAFADQLTNGTAPFLQKSWNWTPGGGVLFVPLIKGLSNRANVGYPTAVSFGYLLNDADGFAVPGIHVRGDGNNDALWQFNPNDKTMYCPGNVYAGGATYQSDGNVGGSIWGGYLSDWLNNQFAARDNNINTRATWDYVNNDNTPTANAANRGAIDGRLNWYRDNGNIDSRIEWWIQARNPGDVGSYAILATTEDYVQPGSVRNGANLQYSDADGSNGGTAAAGNWKLMGYVSGDKHSGSASLWLRIY